LDKELIEIGSIYIKEQNQVRFKDLESDFEDSLDRNLESNNFIEPHSEEIMKKKQGKAVRKRSKRTNKQRAFRMVKILGQGAFANVYLVETQETG
jgi:hypothetical protein